jgi:predicted ATP-grasp superfamily ATP-dependent carboligase
MQIFLYEWATGGGLIEEPGALPASLVREGAAMISAVAADLVRIEGCRVTALRDPRLLHLALPNCNVIDVLSRWSHREELERLSAEADGTILIAPEFDGILFTTAKRVVASGGRLLSPGPDFIRVAADKHVTCQTLGAAGVRVPQGRVLEPEEPLPDSFTYPAVLKPVEGAGSQDTYLVSGPHDAPPAYAWPRRLEPYVSGLATSVAMLCGPGGCVPLEPCKQRISDDGRFRYLGGELPLAMGLANRARDLAKQAIAALPMTTGYVGIDLVLGPDPNGTEDYVIEVNPRYTTSYVGLRAAAETNLAKSMLRVAEGDCGQPGFSTRRLEFDPSGNVSFMQ